MKDLKSILIELKYKKELKDYLQLSLHNEILNDLSIHITNINKSLVGAKTGFNKSKIITDLENIENHLVEIDAHLKFADHD